MKAKQILESLCLKGKITEQHAKEIEEIITQNITEYIQKDIERMEGMRKDGLETKVRGVDDFESTTCEECGGYDECDCSGYNQALQTLIEIKRKELEELNRK